MVGRGSVTRAVQLAAAFLLALFLAGCGEPSSAVQPNQPGQPEPAVESPGAASLSELPNIVLIMTDDQHYDTVQFMPKVTELLVDHGVTFTNAFVTTPNCCPARAGFLSGQYVADHGVWMNAGALGGAPALGSATVVPEQLQSVGYDTAIFGKYLTDYEHTEAGPPRGFDQFLVYDNEQRSDPNPPFAPNLAVSQFYEWYGTDNGSLLAYANSPADYSTDVFADRTIAYLDDLGNSQDPFFVQFAPFAPHMPAVPAPRHEAQAGSFTRTSFPGNYGHLPADHGWPAEQVASSWPNRSARIEVDRSRSIASLLAVDEAVERIVTTLTDTGELDNTVFIFTSDNGVAMGEHQLRGKLCPYEQCLRIPLVIADMRTAGSAIVADAMVTNLDVAAMTLDLAGIDPSLSMPDATLVDFTAPITSSRDHFFIEMYGPGNSATPLGLPPWIGVRTATAKYVRFGTGGEALFDLAGDPWELVNVVDDPAFLPVLEDLRERTNQHFPHEVQRWTVPAPRTSSCVSATETVVFPLVDVEWPPADVLLNLQLHLVFDGVIAGEDRLGLQIEPVPLPANPGPYDEWSLTATQLNGVLRLPLSVHMLEDLVQADVLELSSTAANPETICFAGDAWFQVDVLVPDPTCNGREVNINMNTNGGDGTGSPSADVILGTPGSDVIDAGGGNDTVCANAGDDTVNAGAGDDTVLGGAGDDTLDGEVGMDRLLGQAGADVINGGDGADVLNGGGGDDTLNGDGGDDLLFGTVGLDIMRGGDGADRVVGGDGGDILIGEAGDDVLIGQTGADVLHGGAGDDELIAGLDDDDVNGNGGNDRLIGGAGGDTMDGGAGNDDLFGGPGADALDGGPGAADACNGQTGTDTADASCETITSVP